MSYNLEDIKRAYKDIGISKGTVVALKTDLRLIGPYDCKDQNQSLKDHLDVLINLIDLNKGTIVVSTGTTSLCNTDNVFDINNTPSEMGSLTEFIRNQPDAVRSFHPFTSYAAIGKYANHICGSTTRHSVGPDTPEARLLELDAKYLSIGLHPVHTTTLIHHIEKTMGVPYRYIKEFIHPVVRDGKVVYEPFYLNLRYLECNAVMNLERKVYPFFYKCGYKIKEKKLGRGKIYSFSMNELYLSAVKLLSNDLFACLEDEPILKPYRN
jgi:aminoglycoside 3-N-acetyltransferase